MHEESHDRSKTTPPDRDIAEIVAENERLKDENRRLKALLESFSVRQASALPPVPKNTPAPVVKSDASSDTTKPVVPPPNPPPHSEASSMSQMEKCRLFRLLFRGREDVYAVRWESKKGRAGYSPACANEWGAFCHKPCAKCDHQKYMPLSDEVIRGHILGKHTIGVYPLLQDETCWFLAADFDKDGWQDDAGMFLRTCREMGVTAALERSRSGKGGHVWIFFEEPLPASLARKFGCAILTRAMDRRHQMGLDSYDRFFPNQDTMPKGGFGNLIALPLQRVPREAGNSLFLDDDFVPHVNQWDYLASLKRAPRGDVEGIVVEASRRGQVIGARLSATDETDEEDPWTLPPSKRRAEKPLQGPFPTKIDAVLANLVYVEKDGLSAQFANRLIRLAAFQNPEFYSAQSMRLSTFGKPRVIGCAEEFPKHIGLPRGCLDDLTVFLGAHGITLTLKDERFGGRPLECRFDGVLQPAQEDAIRQMLPFETGVLVAPPGFGKTVLASRLIAERKVNTLVLVHRRSILDQWRERLAAFLGMPLKEIGGFSGEKKKPRGHVDVALIQSLCRKGEIHDLVGDYGHLIIDECHHIPAFTFEQVIRQAKAKYVLGLTATPIRKDGHHPIILMQCGPIRVRVRLKDVAAQRQFRHLVFARETQFASLTKTPSPDISSLYGQIANDPHRNTMIIEDVKIATKAGRSSLVLTERREHIEFLARELEKHARHVIVLQGGMGKKQRAVMDERLKTIPQDEERVIVATGRYAGEGFDDARLDTLFLAMPIAWRGTLQQYVGRLHRTHEGKREVQVYDYVDTRVPVLARMFSKRMKGYRAMGYEPQEIAGAPTDEGTESGIRAPNVPRDEESTD